VFKQKYTITQRYRKLLPIRIYLLILTLTVAHAKGLPSSDHYCQVEDVIPGKYSHSKRLHLEPVSGDVRFDTVYNGKDAGRIAT
jgi:hypothetical protein